MTELLVIFPFPFVAIRSSILETILPDYDRAEEGDLEKERELFFSLSYLYTLLKTSTPEP